MKKFVLIAMLLASFKSWSQDSTAAKPRFVEQYCQMVTVPTGGLFEFFKVNIDIDYGKEVKASKDNRLKDADGKYRVFNTVTDALNYMGQQGWTIVNVYATVTKGSTDNNTYLFKKLVSSSAIK